MSPAERMMRLFAGNTTAYGSHGIPVNKGSKWEIKSTAKQIRGSYTIDHWNKHLEGRVPLGIIPITDQNTCVWGSIDVDEYDGSILDVVARVEKSKLPLIPCWSKSGGVHLFLFAAASVPAITLKTVLHNISATLGISGSEIFPKQVELLTERGDMGNWMVMPYYGDTYGGNLREQVGIRSSGTALTIEQFLDVAEKSRVSLQKLEIWGATAVPDPESKPIKRETGNGIDREAFHDGPVCLQILAKLGVEAGGQNNALLMMGSYYKRKDKSNWKEQLEIAAREYLNPPGSTDGTVSIIRSLEKKDYNYTCKTEPMCGHCNSSLCRTRKYGVGNESDFPSISGMSKLNIDPPLWFIDVDDIRFEVATDDILYYQKFLKVCFDKGRVYSMMKQDTWLSILRPLMEDCTIIEAPPEVSKSSVIIECLEEFCTNRQRGQSKEDLLIGRPWEDVEECRYYFRLKDFQKFLVKEGVKDYSRGQISQRIKHMGGGSKFIKIKSLGVSAFYIPTDAFDHKETVATPELDKDVI
jgi:hypothetical protein